MVFVLCLISASVSAQDKSLSPGRLYELAEREYDDRNFQDAIVLLNRCLRASEAYLEAYPLRASAKEQSNDLHGALLDYSAYLEHFPDHVDALLSRAVLRYKLGFYGQSRDDLLRLLELPLPAETNVVYLKKAASINDRAPFMTTTDGAHRSHIYNYLGLVETKLDNLAAARICFDSALQLNPYEPDYYVNRGLLRERANDPDAIVDYDHALRLNPQHTLALHNQRAWNARHRNSIDMEARLTRTIEDDPRILYPYLERAQERFRKGEYRGAAADYTTALSLDSANTEIWLGRGLSLEKLGEFRAAFSDYTKAIDLDPAFAKAWLNRGNVLLKMGRFADAVEDYTVALIYYPDYAFAYYNRGMAHYRLGKHQEACADLNAAQRLGMEIDERLRLAACDGSH